MTDIAKPRKKSGISGNRAYKIQCKLVERVADIYSCARMFYYTHEQIREQVSKMYDCSDWKRAPTYVNSYVQGYMQARRDDMWQHQFVWLLSCDGKLMTSKEVDVLTEKEKEDKCSAFIAMCEESVRLYAKVGGSCRHPPTREEYMRDFSKHQPSDYKSPWQRVNGELSRHVWKDSAGNPLRDKPCDEKFRRV